MKGSDAKASENFRQHLEAFASDLFMYIWLLWYVEYV